MSNIRGRTYVLKIGDGGSPEVFTQIGGLKTTDLDISHTEPDVSTKDTLAGYTAVDSASAIKTMQFTADGIYDNSNTAFQTMHALVLSQDPSANAKLVTGDGAHVYSGRFMFTKYSEKGPHDGPVTYAVTLRNVGDVTYT